MSSRIKQHEDHTSQSIFHHGLIKLIINTVLQHEGKTWDFFIFWSSFQTKGEDQKPKRQADKGKVLMRKLGKKSKPEDKPEVKVEESDLEGSDFWELQEVCRLFVSSDLFRAKYCDSYKHLLMKL